MSRKKTEAEFQSEIAHRPFESLTPYRGYLKYVTFKCDIDGHIWEALPGNIISAEKGCPVCAGRPGFDDIEAYWNQLKIWKRRKYFTGLAEVSYALKFGQLSPDQQARVIEHAARIWMSGNLYEAEGAQ